MLTTDFFEFGTSTNGLEQQGCGVEMGDAVFGLVGEELGARRAEVARDPQRVRPADQRRPAGRPAERRQHAGALGGLVLRGVRLLDERQQRDRDLGDDRALLGERPTTFARRAAYDASPSGFARHTDGTADR